MAKDKILVFPDIETWQPWKEAIKAVGAVWWPSQGYTVEGMKVIGKNAKTGQDEPSACRTDEWDIPRDAPDGRIFVGSLSNFEHFSNWKQVFNDMGYEELIGQLDDGIVEEIIIPDSWRKYGRI